MPSSPSGRTTKTMQHLADDASAPRGDVRCRAAVLDADVDDEDA
jgi:hypothetical protein